MALLAVLTRALTASVSAALVFVAISFSKATIQFETREPPRIFLDEEFSVELPNCGVIIVGIFRYQKNAMWVPSLARSSSYWRSSLAASFCSAPWWNTIYQCRVIFLSDRYFTVICPAWNWLPYLASLGQGRYDLCAHPTSCWSWC